VSPKMGGENAAAVGERTKIVRRRRPAAHRLRYGTIASCIRRIPAAHFCSRVTLAGSVEE
jgi:hypothetical protein